VPTARTPPAQAAFRTGRGAGDLQWIRRPEGYNADFGRQFAIFRALWTQQR
jgi:hypothetical protein